MAGVDVGLIVYLTLWYLGACPHESRVQQLHELFFFAQLVALGPPRHRKMRDPMCLSALARARR